MRKTLILSTLSLLSLQALAADYYLVVPVKGRTANPVETPSISVVLNGYALPGATVGSIYPGFNFNTALQVSGDPAYTASAVNWSIVSGTLPEGLSLSSAGALSGTPTKSGTSNFSVKASYKTKEGTQTYQIITAAITVTLSSASLPPATMGKAYSYNFKTLVSSDDASYDSNQVVFSGGSLPAGLSLATNGTLSGTPTAPAPSASLQLSVNYKQASAAQTYALRIAEPISLILSGEGVENSQVFTDESSAGTSVLTAGNVKVSYVQKKFGQGSIYFDGNGAYLRADSAFNTLTSKTSPWTMEAQVYQTAAGSTPMIFSCYGPTATGGDNFLLAPSAVYHNNVKANFTQTVPLNSWTHVAASYDGAVLRIFLNGAIVSQVSTTLPDALSTCALGIGVDFDAAGGGAPGNYFPGYMDDIVFTSGYAKYLNAFTPPQAAAQP